LHWWQGDWLSFLHSVLTLAFRLELGSDFRGIMGIIRMATMGLIMAPTTDHIRTTATILGRHSIGTAGIAIITATTVIIGTIGTKLT
jgi:hypothetical protein